MIPKTHSVDQVMGVGQVGVRVDAPKVRLGVTVLEAAFTCSKFLKHFHGSRQTTAVFAVASASCFDTPSKAAVYQSRQVIQQLKLFTHLQSNIHAQ